MEQGSIKNKQQQIKPQTYRAFCAEVLDKNVSTENENPKLYIM